MWKSTLVKMSSYRDVPTYFLAFLLVYTTHFQATGGFPTIDATPKDIFPGLTTSLEINCTFSINNGLSRLAAIVSLVISRSYDGGATFTDLAIVNQFVPAKVNLLTSENITAEGFLAAKGNSFLRLRWQHPSEVQSGLYMCSADGFDFLGRTFTESNSAEAIWREPNLNDYADKMTDMVLGMKQAVSGINNVECTASKMNVYTKALEQLVTEMDNYAKALKQMAATSENNGRALGQISAATINNCQ